MAAHRTIYYINDTDLFYEFDKCIKCGKIR